MSALPIVPRVLGLDFGRARIGVAISDELGLLAHPLETISNAKAKAALQRIVEIAHEKKVARVVVGMPRHLSGEMGTAAVEATAFAEKLRVRLPCPVATWDERLTTSAADRALREAGKTTRETRGFVDQVAAQMILQGYLDRMHQQEEAGSPG